MKITELSAGKYTVRIDCDFDSTEDCRALDLLVISDELEGLVFDFSETNYINSSAFGYTVHISQILSERSIPFKLVHLNEKVATVFKCLGGYQLLCIED